MRSSHVVYVGFGLDDPTFNLVETRLNALDGDHRPQSFAFVPTITDKERQLWHTRHLEIIDYSSHSDATDPKIHDHIHRILHNISVIRKYVQDSEPTRAPQVRFTSHRASSY